MTSVSFLKTTMRTGIPFGVLMGIFWIYRNGFVFGIGAGIISGLFFGLAMGAFVGFQSNNIRKDKPLFSGENLIEDGPANHFLGGEGVGGWLYLTDKRLFFKSHKFNLQVHELSIPLGEISDISRGKSLWIIPNQLRIRLEDGRMERFVVNKPGHWIDVINKGVTNSD